MTTRYLQNFTDVRKWKFAFNLTTPETWHEEVGAVIKAKLISNGGHYAVENALYKYLTLNHFASLMKQVTDYFIKQGLLFYAVGKQYPYLH